MSIKSYYIRYYMVTEINNILENASTLTNIFGNGSGFSHMFTSTIKLRMLLSYIMIFLEYELIMATLVFLA